MVGSSTGIIYTWVGFAIPAALMLVSRTLFFVGARLYVHVRLEGVTLASAARVAVATASKRRAPAPAHPAATLFRTRHAPALVSRLP